MPESMHPMLDSLIEKEHVDSKEDIAAVYADQMDRYTPIALDKSLQGLNSAGGVTNESLAEALHVNGNAVAKNGVMLNVGQDGTESAKPVGEFVQEVISKGESAWDTRLEKEGADKTAIASEMHDYYMGLMEGLEGYNKGALEGIDQAHGDKTEDVKVAMDGLSMVNKEYTQAVMDSMLEYNEKVPFLTEEDFAKLDSLNIEGVGKLSKYEKGGTFHEESFPVYDTGTTSSIEQKFQENDKAQQTGNSQTSKKTDGKNMTPLKKVASKVASSNVHDKYVNMAMDKFGDIEGASSDISYGLS